MALWKMRSVACAAIAVTTANAAALNLHPARDMTFLPRRQENTSASEWPYGPFTTDGRDIVDSNGDAVTWTGINWPGSGETMVPEGLEWQSVEDIIDRIDSIGMNWIRLPYAIEMIDQIYEREGLDVPLEIAMIDALGYANGTKVTREIIEKNPSWTKDTTRFEIWDAITQAAAAKNIYVNPDVHIHKAQWCCSKEDGNSWFGDIDFPIDNWHRGLQYVAEWAKGHSNVVSMSLRNELRPSLNDTELGYNWPNLVSNTTAATDVIHEVNPDILVSWSGMQFDQDLSAVTSGLNLNIAPCYKCDAIRDGYRLDPIIFNLDDHPWANKVFYELHMYSMSEDQDTDDCDIIKAQLYRNGFNALGMDKPEACDIIEDCPDAVRQTPVMLTEFGWAQDETLLNDTLMNCLKDFSIENHVSWAVWSLAGSYRIRSGGQGVDDTWALLNYEWDDWRYQEGVDEYWQPWIEEMQGSSSNSTAA